MIVTYLRSSSISSYTWCAHKFFISSNLGLKEPSGQKAELGNIVHKALELLARKKLAIQNNADTFFDEELNLSFETKPFSIEESVKFGWDHYTDPSRTIHSWTNAHFKQATKWTLYVINFNNQMFNPLNRHIVMPEQYFDFEIDYDWAKYEYYVPGTDKKEKFNGKLRIKGTMDLVTRIDKNLIEYIDYKTGQRKDWSTGKEKEYEDLRKDFQMRLYHYALCKLYPEDDILMTIFFSQAGGPFSLFLDRSHLKETEDIIRTYYQAIQRNNFPKRIRDFNSNSWKCSRLCSYFKENWEGTEQDKCSFIRDQITQIGLDKVVAKFKISESPWGSYGSGGGVTNRDGETK